MREIDPRVAATIAKIRYILDSYEEGKEVLLFDWDRHGGRWRPVWDDDKDLFTEFTDVYKMGAGK